MESIPLLRDLVMLMGMSVLISIVLSRAGLPTIVGFFITGIVIGPYGLGLVTETKTVETLAQIGIVLLLFTIGLEFSVKRMLDIKKEALWGGSLQLLITAALVGVIAAGVWPSYRVALLLGFIVSLSSTAIVLKLLVDRVEVHSSHGSLSVGILLFQDISVVLMVMVIQGFTAGPQPAPVIVKGLFIAIATIALIVVAVNYLAPKLFREVAKLRNREVFILTIVLTCLGTAWLASLAGLSLALGAFVAGLVISESEYANQIVAEVLPFRDTFSSLFFISMGMLVEFGYFTGHIPRILLIASAIILIKAIAVVGVGQILKYPLRLSIIVGLSLAQIGEFSFILIKMGKEASLLSNDLYQTALSVSILTMIATPFLFEHSPGIAAWTARFMGAKFSPAAAIPKTHLANHVIIVGYGINGENLARVLKETGIEHLIMDINSDRIRKAKKDGHRAYFGDSSHPEVLKKMGIDKARMIVLGITDPITTRRTVKTSRELNPSITILVRTRYINEVEDLYGLGANQVITEEFETSVEIFARVLKEYRIPGNVIQNQIDLIRQEGYAMLRSSSLSIERLASLSKILETSVMDTFLVERGCVAEGKTLEVLDLRRKTGGATVMAVIRKGKASTNPRGDFKIETGDMMVIIGNHAELNTAMEILKEKCPA